MATYKLRRLAARVKNAHIRVTDLGWQFADCMSDDESKSMAYIAAQLENLYARITKRADGIGIGCCANGMQVSTRFCGLPRRRLF